MVIASLDSPYNVFRQVQNLRWSSMVVHNGLRNFIRTRARWISTDNVQNSYRKL